ncbi:MAG: O-antigen ligase family protein, partial [Candidatus Limnocylindrales bacterium]
MIDLLRRASAGTRGWLLAERPDRIVVALALIAAVAAAAVCLPRDYQRSGLHVPIVAAAGVMGLGVLLAALAVLRPWPALLGWILAMPWFTAARLGPFVGWIQTTPSTVILVALICGVALGLRRRRPAETGTPSGSGPAAMPFAIGGAIVLLAIVSTAVSPDLSTGIPITMHGIIEPVAAGLLLVAMRPTSRRLMALGATMAASVALAGAASLVRMLTIVHSFGDFQALRAELGRVTYFNVGILGGMLVMAVPFIVIGIVRPAPIASVVERVLGPGRPERGPRVELGVRVAAILVLALVLVVTYLTYSKSAWIAALVIFVGLALAVPATRRGRGLALVAVVLASALVLPYGELIAVATGQSTASTTPPANDRQDSFNPNSPEGEISITGRFLATKAAIAMTVDHPLLGVGPGLFGVEYAGPYHDPTAKEALQSPHDMLPGVAAEYGLPLAILLALVVAAALVRSWRLWRSTADLARLLALAFGLSLVAFMIVATLFGTDLYRAYRYMNTDVLYFGLILGAIVTLRSAAADGSA